MTKLVRLTRDLNDRQSRLCLLVLSALSTYAPPDLHPLIDADVAEAAEALAKTSDTAVRGVIYEHRPASLPAERLATALKAVLADAGRTAGTAFQRDAALVLHRIAESAGEGLTPGSDRKTFVELVARTVRPAAGPDAPAPPDEGSRLILP